MNNTEKCKVTNNDLSSEKLYSEKDVSDYLANFLKGSLSGDCLASASYGEEVNKGLYSAICVLNDDTYGIKNRHNAPNKRKLKCKWCGDILKHDDDSSTECRFCNASPRNPDGSPVADNGNDSSINGVA